MERAIGSFATTSDYRKILSDTTTQLPADAEASVRSEIAAFLGRAPADGSDFKCSQEFVAYRARKDLLRIKDTLLKTNPVAAAPQVCYASPAAIDPARPPKQIEIYGYDLDLEPLQILLMNEFGFQDVTRGLIQRTHYHDTLDLTSGGVTFSPDNRIVAVTWGHLIRHAIPVIQPATGLCTSYVEQVPAGKTIAYGPPLIEGEKPFAGAGAQVLANVVLDYESNAIEATVCMTAVAPEGNGVSGCGGEYVYTTESDRVIEWVFGSLQARTAYTHDARATGQTRETGGPVGRWVFAGFGGKSPAAPEAQVSAQLPTLRLVSTRHDGCVSAMTYLEARRAGGLSAATTRRLDSQLKRVDPAIRQLRPRFAAPKN